MDDPLFMRRFERLGKLLHEHQRLVDRDRSMRNPLRERRPSTSSIRTAARVSMFKAVDPRDVSMLSEAST